MKKPGILIVTVIYNQRIEDTNVFNTLLFDKEHVFVYDNSPSPMQKNNLPEGWEYVADASNPGLSKAYNKAAEYAAEHGFGWILLTDQDTMFPEGALDMYRDYIEKEKTQQLFLPKVWTTDRKCLSPVPSIRYFARITKDAPPVGTLDLNRHAVINSGMLVNTGSFLSCGGYNEDVFLDMSDTQFIERFAERYSTAYLTDICCIQDFSDISDSKDKKLVRFRLLCQSVAGYRPLRKHGRFWLSTLVAKRALSLCLSTRSIRPVLLLMRYYRPIRLSVR